MDQPTTPLVSLAQIHRAQDILRPVLPYTPLTASRSLAARLSAPAFLKCENLQRTGSFKIRGA